MGRLHGGPKHPSQKLGQRRPQQQEQQRQQKGVIIGTEQRGSLSDLDVPNRRLRKAKKDFNLETYRFLLVNIVLFTYQQQPSQTQQIFFLVKLPKSGIFRPLQGKKKTKTPTHESSSPTHLCFIPVAPM